MINDANNECNFKNKNKQNNLVSALKHSQNIIQNQSIQTNNKIVLLNSAIKTVEELRDSLNEKLNGLINQINTATNYLKLENISKDEKDFSFTTIQNKNIVEFVNVNLDSKQLKSEQKPHTSLSFKNQNVTPSRVSFSSFQPTFHNNKN